LTSLVREAPGTTLETMVGAPDQTESIPSPWIIEVLDLYVWFYYTNTNSLMNSRLTLNCR
jgi:hypothetical protein